MFWNDYYKKLEGMSDKELDKEIEESLEECIGMGLLEAAGRNLQGEVEYRQTEKGKKAYALLKAIG